jgi:hypothetical protein
LSGGLGKRAGNTNFSEMKRKWNSGFSGMWSFVYYVIIKWPNDYGDYKGGGGRSIMLNRKLHQLKSTKSTTISNDKTTDRY